MKRDVLGGDGCLGRTGLGRDRAVEMGNVPHGEASAESWVIPALFHLTRPRPVFSDQAADGVHATGTYWDVLGFSQKLYAGV